MLTTAPPVGILAAGLHGTGWRGMQGPSWKKWVRLGRLLSVAGTLALLWLALPDSRPRESASVWSGVSPAQSRGASRLHLRLDPRRGTRFPLDLRPLAEQRAARPAIRWLADPSAPPEPFPWGPKARARRRLFATAAGTAVLAIVLILRFWAGGPTFFGGWKALHVKVEGSMPLTDAMVDRLNAGLKRHVPWNDLCCSEELGFDLYQGEVSGWAKVGWNDRDLATYLRALRAFSAEEPSLRFSMRSEPEGEVLSLHAGDFGPRGPAVNRWIAQAAKAPQPEARELVTPRRERREVEVPLPGHGLRWVGRGETVARSPREGTGFQPLRAGRAGRPLAVTAAADCPLYGRSHETPRFGHAPPRSGIPAPLPRRRRPEGGPAAPLPRGAV